MSINVTINAIDNSGEISERFEDALLRALERCGAQAEGYAVDLVPVDSSYLQQSITHIVDPQEKATYIGTNVTYAPYVELGTGKHYPGGRPTPWSYQDSDGQWHTTSGQEPQPFLKPAVEDHTQTYRNILKDEMENA